jgi:hypothetical protein
MTEEHAGGRTRISRVIRVRPEELNAAFLDPPLAATGSRRQR